MTRNIQKENDLECNIISPIDSGKKLIGNSYSMIPDILKPIFSYIPSINENSLEFIVGGSCICFAKGNPERLSLQDLVDNIIPVLIAAHLGIDVYLYFQSFESLMMSDILHYNPRMAHHNRMLLFLHQGILEALEILEIKPPSIYWINTEDPIIERIISSKSNDLKKLIPKENLFGLYSDDGRTYPKGSPEENSLINVYYRNLSLYYDDFILEFRKYILEKENLKINAEFSNWAIIENIGQRKAIELAGINGNFSKGKSAYFHYTPNRQGKEMLRGNANHKLELRCTVDQLVSRGKILRDSNFQYNYFYNALFPNHSLLDIMIRWKKRVGL